MTDRLPAEATKQKLNAGYDAMAQQGVVRSLHVITGETSCMSDTTGYTPSGLERVMAC